MARCRKGDRPLENALYKELNALHFRPATVDDFEYIYGLCEATMRAYVEIDFGDRFEQIARPTIQKLLDRDLFSKIYFNDLLVGAIASERHETHIQLEELYIEAASQKQGVGTRVVAQLLEAALSLFLPVRLHVLASNGARLFYEKLGFLITRSTKDMNFMEYRHPSIAALAANPAGALPSSTLSWRTAPCAEEMPSIPFRLQ